MEETKKIKHEHKADSCCSTSNCHCGSKLIPALLIIIAGAIIFIIGACFGAKLGNERADKFIDKSFQEIERGGCQGFTLNQTGCQRNNPVTSTTPTTTADEAIK